MLNKLVISKRDAAKLLGCSKEKLNELINKGFVKIFVDIPNGFSTRILRSSIVSYVENNSYSLDQLTNHLNKRN